MSLSTQLQDVVARARDRAPPQAFVTLGAMLDRLASDHVGINAPGPGDRVPDVTFLAADGDPVTLASLHAERPLVLLFYRGRWCPFCDLTLRAYDRIAGQFAAAGAGLVAVSPQTVAETAATGSERGLSFPLLSDPGNAAARAFGLAWRVQEGAEQGLYQGFGSKVNEANGDDSWELPAPAAFVIDCEGVVRRAWTDPDWTRRVEPDEVLAAVRALRS